MEAGLRRQGYRVHLCVVLASHESCMANIHERFERTGRNVPAKLVQDTFEMLNLAVDTYIRQQAHICDRVLLYDNDARQMALAATVCGGEGEAEALAVAQKYLGPSPTK